MFCFVEHVKKVYSAKENPRLLPLAAPFVSLRSIKAMGTCSKGMAPLTLPGQVEEQVQKRERIKALLRDKINCTVRFGNCFLRVQLMFQPCCQGKLVELTVQFTLYLSSGMNNPCAMA